MERVASRSSTFNRALIEFAAKAHELTKQAHDRRSYVLVGKLQQWMRAISRTRLDDNFVTNTALLVHAAYYGKGDSEYSPAPITASRISDGGNSCCIVVFSILLELGLGHWIDIFSKQEILDSKLPVDLFLLKKSLKYCPEGEQVAEQFNERQWKFSPATFSLHMDNDFLESRILPICRKERLGSGGTANVWQIAVESEFVDQKLKNVLAEDTLASYDDQEHGPCYIFALKTFEEGKFQYYRDEKTAFDGLGKNKGMIRRLGCYSHRSPQTSSSSLSHVGKNGTVEPTEGKVTMNLLLEYGTYDLRLVFGHQSPPVFPKETIAFWEALFEVADAVCGIHDFKTGGSEFNGWHSDIKPENILLVRGKYKLADPGFARFKKKTQDRDATPRIRLRGGTDTYGAPEISRQATVHQTIDTWSLGCVFSMAATWVILGYEGVRQYDLVREKALAKILRNIEHDNHPLLFSQGYTADTKPGKIDCFHDGTGVLSEVTSWMTLLRKSARKADPITERVLDMIGDNMLLQDPTQRYKLKVLCKELKGIVDASRKIVGQGMSAESPTDRQHRESIETLLYEIDKEAATDNVKVISPTPSRPLATGLDVKDALKVQLDQAMLKKTSHRFETITGPQSILAETGKMTESPKIVADDTPSVEGPHRRRPATQPDISHRAIPEKRSSLRPPDVAPRMRSNTGLTALSQRRTIMESNHAVQNVIQAHEKLGDSRRKSVSLRNILSKKDARKDEYLSKHFKNRDIKYLVDDAETMCKHWDEATFLLETLATKAHGQDPDGPDLDFINSSIRHRMVKDIATFRKAMQSEVPKRNDNAPVHTNMKVPLERIFHDYLSKVHWSPDKTRVRALTIIILTDGLWTGMANPDEIFNKISQFYRQLEDKIGKGMLKERQVSIQFILFGSDEEARERLRRLDNDMPYYGVEDMIDVEAFSVTGNVFKMLLGSFVEEMDAINDSFEDVSTPGVMSASHPGASMPTRTTTLGAVSEEPSEMQAARRSHTAR